MKSIIRKLTLCALLGASGSAQAINVGVDSGQTWFGYMNWFELPANGGAFVQGQPWGVADLKAEFSGGSLILKACPINDAATPYWYVAAGGPGVAGNKSMEALMYVQKDGPLSGQSVTFSGTVQANSFVSGYNTYAFIKDFAPDYSSVVESVSPAPLTPGPFSVSLNTIDAPGRHVQYGFKTVGANVWPTDVDSKGSIQIQDVPPPFVPDQIPNGDFEIAGGAGWDEESPQPGPQISFPATGGNLSGHAVIDASVNEGFAAIIAFGGAEKTFASLGLAPGDSYTIQLDMKILEGDSIGGVRLVGPDAYTAPAAGLERPALIGDGSTWETYSIPLTVPTSPTQAKFNILWGFNSKVAYDNVKIVLPTPSGPLQATIAQGTSVSWSAGSAVNRYQAQESANIGGPFTNLGPAIIGNSVSSVFDSSTSPFYQVLESTPTVTETVYNGSFDEQGDFVDEADGWTFVQSQPAERLTTGGRNGLNDECIRILVLNAGAAPEGCEIQQNTKNADSLNPGAGAVIPGNTYDFSFYAKQVSSGVSYEQRFRISWLNDIGGVIGDEGFQNFPLPITGNWVQVPQNGLVAPAGATTALIQILGVTGAVEGGSGEVLIDDVTMLSTGFGSPAVLAATAIPAVEISWPSTTGQDYQVQSSPNLVDWSNFGGVINGDNTTKAVYDAITPPAKFYKVGELP